METIGERLKRLRLEHNYTTEYVGKFLGIQKAAVGKHENGAVENIPIKHIIKLSRLYNVTPSYLLCFDCDDAILPANANEAWVLKYMKKLDDHAQVNIINQLKNKPYTIPVAARSGKNGNVIVTSTEEERNEALKKVFPDFPD